MPSPPFFALQRAGPSPAQDAMLHSGRLEELGSHRELLRRGGRYARLFRLQAAGYAEAGAPGTAGAA